LGMVTDTILAAFIELVPAFSRLVGVLFLIMCTFGQVAIPAFGGKIYPEAPALNGTAFLSNNYCANNFVRHAHTGPRQHRPPLGLGEISAVWLARAA
jgi:hypothetical protein